ncbi:uncharacterized protein [Misgurnus anguillicaudatus]|uniref:uncharacterized protein n=1 Tax=Misgurnus anguillicaudatus TaxID=75329 RepID=UPI003CCF5FAE
MSCKRCKRQKTRLKGLVSDLNKQVDALSSALQEVTRRCKRLIRRPSAHQTQQVKDVAKKLLKALEVPAEEDTATPAVTSPPRSPEFRPSTSRATEAEHLGERSPAHFPDHVAVLNELLESYRRHQEGLALSGKLKENVSGKVFRIRSFVAHMAEGQARLQTLAFLDDPERIRRWGGNLGRSKITATTVNHYLKNVAQFLDFLAETPPKTCRLSKNAMTRVGREVRLLLRSMKRPVTMHQMEVKEVKEGQLISKQVLRCCNAEAKKANPRILDKLEKDLCQKTQYSFYGHLTAFFASIYGHRCGVFQNLTIAEVEKAVKSSSTGAYLINVSISPARAYFPSPAVGIGGLWVAAKVSGPQEPPGRRQDGHLFFFYIDTQPLQKP